jgi:UPF0716 protein FxsA
MRPVVVVLLVLLIVVPIAEISAIVFVGEQIGALPTVLLLLGSAIVGTWLLRREGTRTLQALRTASREGRTPALEAVEGLFVLVGGLLMMLPGFITDIVGLLLVLPPTRRLGAGVALQQIARRLPPAVAADLLDRGTVRVKSRRGRARRDTPPPADAPPPLTPPPPQGQGKVIEGEIEP